MTNHAHSPSDTPQAKPQAPAEFEHREQSADLTPTLKILLTGRTLTAEQAASAFEAMMTGRCHHGVGAGFVRITFEMIGRRPNP